MAYGPVNVPGKLTAAQVGAAEAGHTHTVADIPGVLSASCNVNGLSLQIRGTGDPSSYIADAYCTAIGNGAKCLNAGVSLGFRTESHGYRALAMGGNSKAYANYSVAIGFNAETTEAAQNAVALGHQVTASAPGQCVVGSTNKASTDETDRFIVGGDDLTDSTITRSNCFRVNRVSGTYARGSYNSTGADYAENFEWADGNPEGEDRIGRFVTLEGTKIRLAAPEDEFILGIVSGNPSVVGDSYDDSWNGMFLTDVYGRPILEHVEIPDRVEEIPDPDDSEKLISCITQQGFTTTCFKLNPAYDPEQEYVPRSKRLEWGCVGLMGKLVVIDDGSCQVNGWVAVGEGGIGTASEERTKFRMMERLDRDDGHYVRVLVL